MKRHKKKELLDILSSLEELNRVIGRKFDSALPVSVERLGGRARNLSGFWRHTAKRFIG